MSMSRKTFRAFALCAGLLLSIPGDAQVITDSLANDFRSFAAQNIARYRTMNLYWETKGRHDYTLEMNDEKVEKGRKADLHTIRFSTMLPIVKRRKVSLYANFQYSNYQFDNKLSGDGRSLLFTRDDYNYYAGGINGSYYMSLFNKPVVLSANVTLDGWDEGFGKAQGRFSAVMVITRKPNSSFSAGIMGMTLFSSMPVMPVLAYWRRFNPKLSVDITLPGQFYLRYQMGTQRLSAGSSMSGDNFYLKAQLKERPETYYYSEAVLKPEVLYEYIINKHFYLSVHAGLSMVMKSGIYKKNRKGVKVKDEEGKSEVEPLVKQDRSPIPFFNIGISYSLFKR